MRFPALRPFTWIAIAFGVLCAVYVASTPEEVHWSGDSAAKELAVRSIRYETKFRYDVPYLGKHYDPGLWAVPVGETYYDIRDGEVHISWPELFPLLVFPFYKIIGWRGLFVVPLLAGAASIWLSGKIAELIRPKTGWIAALVLALSSPMAIYSSLLWEHTPAVFLMLVAVWSCLMFRRDGKLWRVATGFAAVGLAAAGLRTDVNMFFASLGGAMFLMTKGRTRFVASLVALAGFVAGASPASALNWITNGKILAANTMKNAPPPSLKYITQVHVNLIPHFLAGKQVPLPAAWLVILGGAAIAAAYYLGKGRSRALITVAALTAIVTGCIMTLVDLHVTKVDRFHGFLVMSPVLALAPLLSPRLDTQGKSDAKLLLLTTGLLCSVNMLALGLQFPEGWTSDLNREWGPRYWLIVFPLLAICFAVSFDALGELLREGLERQAHALALALLGALGIGFEAMGFSYILASNEDQHLLRWTFEQRGDTPLLTDVYLASSFSPNQFFARPSFYMPAYSPDRFQEWLAVVAPNGLTHFDFATFSDLRKHVFLKSTPPGWKLEIEGDITRDRDLRIARVRAVRDESDTQGAH